MNDLFFVLHVDDATQDALDESLKLRFSSNTKHERKETTSPFAHRQR